MNSVTCTMNIEITICSRVWDYNQPYIYICVHHDGILKWKSHDITKAKTKHARMKFNSLWPLMHPRPPRVADDMCVGPTIIAPGFISIDPWIDGVSFGPIRLLTIELQISHVLIKIKLISRLSLMDTKSN